MHCDWRLKNNKNSITSASAFEQKAQQRSCGALHHNLTDKDDEDNNKFITSTCHWQDAIFIAWCLEQHQSFTFHCRIKQHSMNIKQKKCDVRYCYLNIIYLHIIM